MDEQSPLEFNDWARKYRGMAGVTLTNSPENHRALFKMREDYGQYVSGFSAQKAITGGSFTNAEGRVVDYIVKPKDVEVEILKPDTLNTSQGLYSRTSPTNAVRIVDANSLQGLDGYVADPSMTGAPAPGIGGAGMTVTNAPTAAPAQTPAPSPTPPQLREGMRVRQNGITYVITNGVPVPVTGP